MAQKSRQLNEGIDRSCVSVRQVRQIYEWKVDRWNVNVLIIKLKWQQAGMDTKLDEGVCVPVDVSVRALMAGGCCDVIGEVEPLLQLLDMHQDIKQNSRGRCETNICLTRKEKFLYMSCAL